MDTDAIAMDQASEIEKGPIVRLDGGVSYRELSPGAGPGDSLLCPETIALVSHAVSG